MDCATLSEQSRDRLPRRSRAKAGKGAVCIRTAIAHDNSSFTIQIHY